MGTTYTVRIVSPPDSLSAYEARIAIEEELRAIDESMSAYRADSELSKFNAAKAHDWIDVSRQLATVVAAALEVSRRSNGAFDITVAPLVNLWGFGPAGAQRERIPDAMAIAAAKASVDYEALHVRADPPALRKEAPALEIDLNGIAPGYAVDRIAAHLDALDVDHYMVDIGGEIRVRGRNATGELWRVAVERPKEEGLKEGSHESSAAFAVLHLADKAVATSGEYRHYIRKGGRRYSHTIDPRTGVPIAHTLASVVVVHDQAMYADAWATAYNVLGPTEGYELAVRLAMPVMFIVEENGALEARMTPTFKQYLSASK